LKQELRTVTDAEDNIVITEVSKWGYF